jgi:outer membrane lipoprotein carrier protein
MIRCCFFLAALLLLFPVLASPANDARIATEAFESRYQHARTLRAIFFEAYRDGKGAASADSGTVYFSRPGRMRWEYESPETKLFLVDGTNVWFYVPADRTVTRAKLSQSSDWRTPLALLAGKADLSKLCGRIELAPPASASSQVPAPPPDSGPATTLRCIPRESPESEAIHVVLLDVTPDGFLTRLVIQEAGNASTEFRFANWQEDIPIPEVKFHFDPPPGVAVVDEQSLANTIR